MAFVALAACTSSPPPAHVSIGAPTAAWSAPREEPARTIETCEAFRARMKSEMGVALASHAPRIAPNEARAPDTFVGFCAETANGSWRVEIPEWKSLGSYEDIRFAIEARYVVVHLGHDGVAARYATETTLDDYGERDARPPVLFDFDGDGEPEIFVDVREVGDEGHVARQSALLTFLGGAVVPYAPAQGFDIDSLADVDEDGRPDFEDLCRIHGHARGLRLGVSVRSPAAALRRALAPGRWVQRGGRGREEGRARLVPRVTQDDQRLGGRDLRAPLERRQEGRLARGPSRRCELRDRLLRGRLGLDARLRAKAAVVRARAAAHAPVTQRGTTCLRTNGSSSATKSPAASSAIA